MLTLNPLRRSILRNTLFSFLFITIFISGSYAQCPGTNTGFVNASFALNNTTGGTDPWSNPGNALTDNNSYATLSNAALLIGGTVRNSNFLVLRNLGLSVPVNANICGVQVEIRKASSDNNGSNWTRDLDIRLLKGNQIVGTNHANTGVNWPTTETAFTYGNNADLWGTTLKGFDVSNNGFGIAIAVESRAAGLLLPTVISYIDAVRIRVYYTVPTTDIDGDGLADNNDSDMDGDGLPNSRELLTCTASSSITLDAIADPSLSYPSATGIQASFMLEQTAGAGVSQFDISDAYTAVSGPEINITQDVAAATDQSVFRLRFNAPVHNLRFKLQDIDVAAGQFADQVQVDAYSHGQRINLGAGNYTIGSGNFNHYIGNNTFQGLVAMGNNELNGTITITIPDMVDSVRITYRNEDVNLGVHAMGIGEISFCNPYSAAQDFDGDGQPGFHDMDSDNDGIPDYYEIQSSATFIAASGADSDGDGIDNAFDVSTGGTALIPVDTDTDGTPDFKDSDSDNDASSDMVEGNDANHNCVADFNFANIDTDGDGLDNNYDPHQGGTSAPMQDTDGNGIPDYRQATIPTAAYAGTDKVGNFVIYTMNANTPANGRGYWTVLFGSGTFANINDPITTVTNVAEGANIYTWTIYTDGCHSSADQVSIIQSFPLPVNMSSLLAKPAGERVMLKWTTYSEQNNKGFAVMHSTDGISWKQLEFTASLATNGNSSTQLHYTTYHTQPALGKNYYRLHQQDIDGTISYSNIATTSFSNQAELIVHPNPVTSQLFLSGNGGQNIKLLKLSDAMGKTVFVSHKATNSHVDMTAFSKGWYFLQVIYQDGSVKSNKILKQ